MPPPFAPVQLPYHGPCAQMGGVSGETKPEWQGRPRICKYPGEQRAHVQPENNGRPLQGAGGHAKPGTRIVQSVATSLRRPLNRSRSHYAQRYFEQLCTLARRRNWPESASTGFDAPVPVSLSGHHSQKSGDNLGPHGVNQVAGQQPMGEKHC